jgi:hypothetical protein
MGVATDKVEVTLADVQVTLQSNVFMSPRTSPEVPGMWWQCYEKWWMMIQENLSSKMVGLVTELAISNRAERKWPVVGRAV